MITKQETKEFWDKAQDYFAHLTIDKGKMYLIYDRMLKHIEFKDKKVIDFGCGGGHFLDYLFTYKGIKSAVAYDISQRQLTYAANTLNKKDVEFINTNKLYSFKNKFADIFISIAVIQHMPNQEMLDELLNKVNKSQIPIVILQIRYGNQTKFTDRYVTELDAKFGCITNDVYLSKKLTNYKITLNKKITGKTTSIYQWLTFSMK